MLRHLTLLAFAWSFVSHSKVAKCPVFSYLFFVAFVSDLYSDQYICSLSIYGSEVEKIATKMQKGGSQNSGESQGPVVSSWSCFNCRRRKSRCNRQNPCGFCSKAGVECLYPFTGRMPTRQHNSATAAVPSSRTPPRKQSQAQVQELLSRLRQLENVVDSLKAQAQDKDFIPGHTDSGNTSPSRNDESSTAGEEESSIDAHTISSRHNLSYGLSKSFGKLHVCESGSMYTGNGFWAALHGEVTFLSRAYSLVSTRIS